MRQMKVIAYSDIRDFLDEAGNLLPRLPLLTIVQLAYAPADSRPYPQATFHVADSVKATATAEYPSVDRR